ncbi:MAG: isoprenyl transferase [Agathobacter sp.]|nr:isoprenyl transferase [Agathobacter sp.]
MSLFWNDTKKEKRFYMKIPQHVAIILDGNGRWAKSKGMPRNYGHTMGAKNVEEICRDAYKMGIKYLTFYAFSTENWNRPDSEVSALMGLLENYLKTCLKTADKNNIRVRIIGDKTRLAESFQKKIKELEEVSAKYTGLNLTIAINYGSRDEMVRAMRKMMQDEKEGKFALEDLSEESFSKYLDTNELPDPDLLIRTSGEQRLSNYLLWQLAYSEFYFTDVPWPDFHKEELEKAIEAYNKRDRRFGALKEE